MATTWVFNSTSDSGHKPAIAGQLASVSENTLCLRNPWVTDSVFMGKLYCAITVISLIGFYPQILPITLDLYNENIAIMLLFLISPFPFVPFLIYRIYFIKNLSSFCLNRSTQKNLLSTLEQAIRLRMEQHRRWPVQTHRIWWFILQHQLRPRLRPAPSRR